MSAPARAERARWRIEVDGFARALAGALLFGVPLLYTLEMWELGGAIDRWKLLALLALAFAGNLALARFSGFKDQARTLAADVEEAVEALAVGAVAAAIVLLALGRITPGGTVGAIAGQIAILAVPLSIGASVANAVLVRRGASRQGEDADAPADPWRATALDVGATAIGAVFIASTIAPTEEVRLLARDLSAAHVIALIALSLAVTYAIVFEAEFTRHQRRRAQPGLFQRPVTETAMAYVVSLAVALVALFLFDQIEIGDRLGDVAARTIVLGLPASIGGAAGRLVV